MTSGVALVVKPPGCSSHDVVRAIGRRTGAPCGHLGTLDPLAAGLLVVAVGGATRLIRYAEGQDKEYLAEFWFGLGTASQDLGGPVADLADASGLGEAQVLEALAWAGRQTLQRPPDYSAVQVAGQRAYRAARAGRPLELAERPAALREAGPLEFRPGARAVLRARLWVSPGYYVRALARDLGAYLGLPCVLGFLLRLRSGPFRLEQARTLEEEPELAPKELLVQHLPSVEVSPAEAERLGHGQRLPGAGDRAGLHRLGSGGRLVAVAEARAGVWHPETVCAMED